MTNNQKGLLLMGLFFLDLALFANVIRLILEISR